MSPKNAPHMKTRFQGNREGIQIIKVAAFCFAIISWLATAQGLHQYVFSYEWQAYLVSFGIQSILFVFNLKLPVYFHQIGEKTPTADRCYRKYHFGDKKGQSKNSFRWTSMQRIIAIFYALVLLSSSLFSFVFICDLVVYHHQSGYSDDNAILSSTYTRILNDTEDYARECVNALLLLSCEQTTQLSALSGQQHSAPTTKEDLERAALQAKEEADRAEATYMTAQKLEHTAKDILDDLYDARFWMRDAYMEAYKDYRQAQEYTQQVNNIFIEKRSAHEEAKELVNKYQPSFRESVSSLLVELMDKDPDPAKFESSMDDINRLVINIGENGQAPENFSEIVQHTQSLNISIDGIVRLKDATDKVNNLRKLSQSVVVPDPKSEGFRQQETVWKQYWVARFTNLREVIQDMPSFPEQIATNLDTDALDLVLLASYDSEEVTNEIYELIRTKLSDINVIERSFSLLTGKYKFTAIFSASLALFLDACSLLAGLFVYYISSKSCKQIP